MSDLVPEAPMADDKLAEELARALATARAERWSYTKTLDPDDLLRFIAEESIEHNTRADITFALSWLAERGRPHGACRRAALDSDGHAHDPGCLYLAGLRDGRTAACQAIRSHADEHFPPDGLSNGSQRAFRRHLLAAARIADNPITKEEAAEALRQDNYIACRTEDIEADGSYLTTPWEPAPEETT
jgi:hypothetical protein